MRRSAMRSALNRSSTMRSQALRTDFFDGSAPAGISRLSKSLTINGITKAPDAWFEGRDASLSSWTARIGDAAAIASTGTDPTLSQDVSWTSPVDLGVLLNGGKVYQQASALPFALKDIVIEMVLMSDGSGTETLLSNHNGSGWSLYTSSTSLRANIGAESLKTITSNVPHHAIAFFDRSGNVTLYVDSSAGTTVSIAGSAATNMTRGALTIGSTPLFATKASGAVVYQAAVWSESAWLDTSEQAAIATARYAAIGL